MPDNPQPPAPSREVELYGIKVQVPKSAMIVWDDCATLGNPEGWQLYQGYAFNFSIVMLGDSDLHTYIFACAASIEWWEICREASSAAKENLASRQSRAWHAVAMTAKDNLRGKGSDDEWTE